MSAEIRRQRMRGIWLRFRAVLRHKWFKRIRYWAIVLFLIGAGLRLGDWLGEREFWIETNYTAYRLLQKLTRHRAYPQRTCLILIGDDEYWKGELGGRSPIKRTYLARLLRALDQANPAVIALDFDLSSPMPDGSIVEHPDYQTETKEFVEALEAVSEKRSVVLPRTVSGDEPEGVLDSTIFDGPDWRQDRVRMGHIQLPDDVRRIPLSVPLKGGGRLDSFAEAIVRADNEEALEDVAEQDEFPYGSYIKADKFPQLSADRVLGSDPKTLESEIGHKIVIVGGIWHRFGFGAGAQTDTYSTPEGDLPGVFIHANYVEALLCSQMFKPVKEVVKKSIDALVSLVVAIAFALRIRFRRKLGIAAGLCVLLAILSYVFLQNLGMFCDFLIPVLFVMAHFAGEQILEWRKDARKYAKSLSNLVTPTNGG